MTSVEYQLYVIPLLFVCGMLIKSNFKFGACFFADICRNSRGPTAANTSTSTTTTSTTTTTTTTSTRPALLPPPPPPPPRRRRRPRRRQQQQPPEARSCDFRSRFEELLPPAGRTRVRHSLRDFELKVTRYCPSVILRRRRRNGPSRRLTQAES